MTQPLILVVEDDPDLRELMMVSLTNSGYRTVAASDGDRALERFHASAPDLVLLDIALGPHSIDGLEVCRRIRRDSDVPVVFLTTHSDAVDQIVGFSSGADDYVTKPVNHRLLLARIAAILRRVHGASRSSDPTELVANGIALDLVARTVMVNGTLVDLTRIQFDLLVPLVEDPRRVVTRDQLVGRVWGEWYGTDHHLDVHLSRLRQRIIDAGGPRVAHAVRGVGYRLTS
ncbi:response regulator transcription factor [Tessaracoccus sp. MC1865]|uniref:response regulator transcription factor n=1 Tax=Tessaracoccus sp. MC1865 TaxID=2760310 RepID=UPI0016016982|nr:response regulator transcription factor [Tessaracoccus sp. MC1865]MBB1482439.1 response regulator transcription factor [Tessaracoccus sp. MC1865]QTO38104.1 response regulator transcription factor [Tessaracoccus sp. MC1865]